LPDQRAADGRRSRELTSRAKAVAAAPAPVRPLGRRRCHSVARPFFASPAKHFHAAEVDQDSGSRMRQSGAQAMAHR